ncbi:MAG: hypothetical protein AB7P03_22710 [Kofleriaceae bacterium]
MRDPEGKVPGLPGFAIKHRRSTKHCGGIAIATIRSSKVAKEDAVIAAFYKIEFPMGLSFDPDPAQRKLRDASMKRFNDFIDNVRKSRSEAVEHYMQAVNKTDPTGSVIAAARIAQINLRLASVLARAEIPGDVRTGDFADEKIGAYCERMSSLAETVQTDAEAALGVCAERSKDVGAGWWTELCVEP